jgi:hypothetical protein
MLTLAIEPSHQSAHQSKSPNADCTPT